MYRVLFENLETQEARLNSEAPESMTSFGDAGTPYVPTIKGFYSKWLNFSTKNPMAHADVHSFSGYESRPERRHLEKENKKNRENERHVYNTTVRSLVKFVRRRDPRVKIYMDSLPKKTSKEAQKSEKKKDDFVPSWAIVDESEYLRAFDLEDPEQEQEITEFYCEACKKSFKSASQWKNHEISKKHKTNVRQVLKKLRKQRNHLDFEKETSTEGDIETSGQEESEAEKHVIEESSSSETVIESEVLSIEDSTSEIASESEESYYSESSVESVEPSIEDIMKSLELASDEESDGQYVSKTKKGLKKPPKSTQGSKTKNSKTLSDQSVPSHERSSSTSSFSCETCKHKFPSRNALFKHIKASRHAAYK